jgi:hypothetical protein
MKYFPLILIAVVIAMVLLLAICAGNKREREVAFGIILVVVFFLPLRVFRDFLVWLANAVFHSN